MIAGSHALKAISWTERFLDNGVPASVFRRFAGFSMPERVKREYDGLLIDEVVEEMCVLVVGRSRILTSN